MTKNPERFGMHICDLESLTTISSMESCVVETMALSSNEITELRLQFEDGITKEMERLLHLCPPRHLCILVESFTKYEVYSRWASALTQNSTLHMFISLLHKGDAFLSNETDDEELAKSIPLRCNDTPTMKNGLVTINGQSFDALPSLLYRLAGGKLSVREIFERAQIKFPGLTQENAIIAFRTFEGHRLLCFMRPEVEMEYVAGELIGNNGGPAESSSIAGG